MNLSSWNLTYSLLLFTAADEYWKQYKPTNHPTGPLDHMQNISLRFITQILTDVVWIVAEPRRWVNPAVRRRPWRHQPAVLPRAAHTAVQRSLQQATARPAAHLQPRESAVGSRQSGVVGLESWVVSRESWPWVVRESRWTPRVISSYTYSRNQFCRVECTRHIDVGLLSRLSYSDKRRESF